MGDRLWVTKLSRYVTSHLGQLSLPSLRGGKSSTSLHWMGLMRGVFTCVGWQCDPIWQVASCSSELDFPQRAILFNLFLPLITSLVSVGRHYAMVISLVVQWELCLMLQCRVTCCCVLGQAISSTTFTDTGNQITRSWNAITDIYSGEELRIVPTYYR